MVKRMVLPKLKNLFNLGRKYDVEVPSERVKGLKKIHIGFQIIEVAYISLQRVIYSKARVGYKQNQKEVAYILLVGGFLRSFWIIILDPCIDRTLGT